MRNILVPVDGSDSSIKAIEYALARRKRGEKFKTVVLYVQPVPIVFNKAVEQILIEDRDGVFLNPRIKSLLKRLNVKPQVASGETARTITKFAETHACDEIVMGTRGHGAAKRFILGSVATKVVHFASMPVTLVK